MVPTTKNCSHVNANQLLLRPRTAHVAVVKGWRRTGTESLKKLQTSISVDVLDISMLV